MSAEKRPELNPSDLSAQNGVLLPVLIASQESPRDVLNREFEVTHDCAIVGIYSPGNLEIADQMVDALVHLNHRGQEGAGIFARGAETTFLHKAEGLAGQVFPRDNERHGEQVDLMRSTSPDSAIGQGRYSTSGTLTAWQPFVDGEGRIAMVHNGNITNATKLLSRLPESARIGVTSDTQAAHRFILHSEGDTVLEQIQTAVPQIDGAFSLILDTPGKLIGLRDPWGMRPLSLGRLKDNKGWILASETAAFTNMSATFIRDIEPGEMVVIEGNSGDVNSDVHTVFRDPRSLLDEARFSKQTCSFEPSYIQAPDSLFERIPVTEIRREMGRIMARKDAEQGYFPEVVGGIQESGIVYAEGYLEQMIAEMILDPEKFGIYSRAELVDKLPKHIDPLIKNAHAEANRAFMRPSGRRNATELKHRPAPYEYSGKRLLLFDDSIVRSTTMMSLVRMVRSAYKTYEEFDPEIGPPQSVDIRIGFPLIKFICNWGVDFQDPKDLASQKYSPLISDYTDEQTIEDIRRNIGADSLKFPTAQDHVFAIKGDSGAYDLSTEKVYPEFGLCGHCITGVRPTPVEGLLIKEDAKTL